MSLCILFLSDARLLTTSNERSIDDRLSSSRKRRSSSRWSRSSASIQSRLNLSALLSRSI
eukprot:CAMPEP_0169481908 /NCGR_PEP_ID=MMETSP1042-20121227/30388_1 /TAXON_ID=464988 /ORGANISM="Hemiselmis andersenii, Strain CCMP1180" /LENGTH=59 /DNA_ID=CAMNT_0009596731 /DNA_START=76 /DNA_END=252 /DNA_ORIENTATION=+